MLKWEEIKKLKLPEPTYIKTAGYISRKIRRKLKIEGTNFVCPKDKTGGFCYTCSRKGE